MISYLYNLADEGPDVRASAALPLGAISDFVAVYPLILTLNDEDPFVRANAATALGSIGDTKAINPLIDALSDEEPWVRVWVSRALRDLCEAAIDPLKRFLDSDVFE